MLRDKFRYRKKETRVESFGGNSKIINKISAGMIGNVAKQKLGLGIK